MKIISGPLGGCSGLGPQEETPPWEGIPERQLTKVREGEK